MNETQAEEAGCEELVWHERNGGIARYTGELAGGFPVIHYMVVADANALEARIRDMEGQLAEAQDSRDGFAADLDHAEERLAAMEGREANIHAHYRGEAKCPDPNDACWGCTLANLEGRNAVLEAKAGLLDEVLTRWSKGRGASVTLSWLAREYRALLTPDAGKEASDG